MQQTRVRTGRPSVTHGRNRCSRCEQADARYHGYCLALVILFHPFLQATLNVGDLLVQPVKVISKFT